MSRELLVHKSHVSVSAFRNVNFFILMGDAENCEICMKVFVCGNIKKLERLLGSSRHYKEAFKIITNFREFSN